MPHEEICFLLQRNKPSLACEKTPCKDCNCVFTKEPKAAIVWHRGGPSQLKVQADRGVNLSPMLMRSREHSRGLNTNCKDEKGVCLGRKDFLVRFSARPQQQQQLDYVAKIKPRVAHLTLSLSAEDTSRRQQNPTGDPHLSDLSSPPSCNHGSRRHRRAPGAPSPSPRWEHVARWPHTPGKSPGCCCWSCASDCSSLVMRCQSFSTKMQTRVCSTSLNGVECCFSLVRVSKESQTVSLESTLAAFAQTLYHGQKEALSFFLIFQHREHQTGCSPGSQPVQLQPRQPQQPTLAATTFSRWTNASYPSPGALTIQPRQT
ncbi:hypothetical protein GBF38_022988 [Nibea albiflora]|uniref:Uncharacterized protein n=1 Tax=Nibea albiflora TaxID=240163 RepID=A0ACB7EYB0_NIBAL|nr:hypothetical protein GBF38_022988 [Nibea albiflora]